MNGGEPAGGRWNYDAKNRGAFPKGGPGVLQAPARFIPDAITRGVIDLVNTRFADHPGSLANFDWPAPAAGARVVARRLRSMRSNGWNCPTRWA